MTSTHRTSGSGPEPFEACPDGGRCWHGCPLAVATMDHPEGEGLPCWRVANASPMGDADDWPRHTLKRHGVIDDSGIHEVDQRALDALGETLVPEVRDRLLVALSAPTLPAHHAVHAWGETYARIAPVVAALMVEAALAHVPEPDPDDSARHRDALADTGDAYVTHRGWTLDCLWCGYSAHGTTKRDALIAMQAHYDTVLPGEKATIR